MQNHHAVSGVFHRSESEKHYQLRRYAPPERVQDLVEQFWIVDWQLPVGDTHTQRNLPDPNFHLVIDNGEAKIIGPVSKVFTYAMSGAGRVIGVKFKTAAIINHLSAPASRYTDKSLDAVECFGEAISDCVSACTSTSTSTSTTTAGGTDEHIIAVLEQLLAPFNVPLTPAQQRIGELLTVIKHNSAVSSVAVLSQVSGWSVRTLQRNFTRYVGLSPKWLIRKYRLHDALEALESRTTTMSDLVSELGYSDQSHLIRDFSSMLGMTPGSYCDERS